MKKELRKEIIKKRRLLNPKELEDKSHLILDKIMHSVDILRDMNVMIYMDYKNEVKTKDILQYIISQNAHVILPRVDMSNHTLTLHRVENTKELILSDYGILEPKLGYNTVTINDVDLILAPGVAFDKRGYRLGYGGGFYDQLLSHKRKEVQVVALAFDCQMVETVPTEPHDYRMDMIITESSVFKSFE